MERALPDVPFAVKEMQSIKTVFQKFIKDERDFYHHQSPTMAQIEKTVNHIKLRLENNPETNYCVIFVAIGHGILKEGSMNVIINQWDDAAKYYTIWDLEELNNKLALRSNCYGTVIFATSKVQYNVA